MAIQPTELRPKKEPVSLEAALEAGKKVAPDVTGLLADDHRTVLGWFVWYDSATDPRLKRKIVRMVCMALRAHMAGEEECFYPAARDLIDDEDLVGEAEDEHEEAKDMLDELEAGPGEDEEAELMRQLNAAIAHHVKEEETRLFPAVRAAGMDLYAVGAAVASRRVECLFEMKAA